MKATIDLPEALLAEARKVAERRGWTFGIVVEESLRAFIAADGCRTVAKPFPLRHTVVRGQGLADPGMTFAGMRAASGIGIVKEWPERAHALHLDFAAGRGDARADRLARLRA